MESITLADIYQDEDAQHAPEELTTLSAQGFAAECQSSPDEDDAAAPFQQAEGPGMPFASGNSVCAEDVDASSASATLCIGDLVRMQEEPSTESTESLLVQLSGAATGAQEEEPEMHDKPNETEHVSSQMASCTLGEGPAADNEPADAGLLTGVVVVLAEDVPVTAEASSSTACCCGDATCNCAECKQHKGNSHNLSLDQEFAAFEETIATIEKKYTSASGVNDDGRSSMLSTIHNSIHATYAELHAAASTDLVQRMRLAMKDMPEVQYALNLMHKWTVDAKSVLIYLSQSQFAKITTLSAGEKRGCMGEFSCPQRALCMHSHAYIPQPESICKNHYPVRM
jgi:hypothetical protein